MKFTAVCVALAFGILGSAPARAQVNNDVRCLMASNLFAKASKDQKQKVAAEATRLYYVGRIHGRLTAAQLKAEFLAQQKSITPKNAGTVMNGCARQTDAGLKMIQNVSQQIVTRKPALRSR